MSRFEEIEIGQSDEFTHTITNEDVDAFCSLTGDNNPVHMDDDYSGNASFGGRVVHGMLTASFISTIIGTKIPGNGSLWYEQSLRFIKPVRINQIIRIYAKVIHKSEAQKIITLETLIYDDKNQIIVKGEAKVKVFDQIESLMSDSKKKDNGVVIISGGSGGVGREIARVLGKNNYKVVVNYFNNKQSAEEICNEIIGNGGEAVSYYADITNEQDVINMLEYVKKTYQNISAIVNNASHKIENKKFSDLQWLDIHNHFNVQLKGAFNLCKNVLPYFDENEGGSIVNIGSLYIDGQPPAQVMDYVISKSALHALTKTLAVELGSYKIRVNMVSPSLMLTNMTADLPEKVKMLSKVQSPLKRLCSTRDVANTVLFLVGEQSAFITGENIRLNGGQIMI